MLKSISVSKRHLVAITLAIFAALLFLTTPVPAAEQQRERAETPSVQGQCDPGDSHCVLVPPADPEALWLAVKAVREASQNQRFHSKHTDYRSRISPRECGRQLVDVFREVARP